MTKKEVTIAICYHGVNFTDTEDTYPFGNTFSEMVYEWFERSELDRIEFVEMDSGKAITPTILNIRDYDRSHKDLYWWYSRYEDYGKIIEFRMDRSLIINVYYKEKEDRVALKVDVSSIKEVLYDEAKASYLYCQEMTYNDSKCHFNDNDIFYFDLEDDMTFGVCVKTGSKIRMLLNGEPHEPTKVQPSLLEGYDIVLFGTLDESDIMGDTMKGEGEHIRLKETLSKVKFIYA